MHLLRSLVKSLRLTAEMTLANFRAKGGKQPIVVFESDDWGSIRLRDRKTFESLERKGLNPGKSPFNTFDCLERKEDLDSLLNVLEGINSNTSFRPIFTLNTVLCNPDFDRIQAANFENYYGESFLDSYRRYYGQNLTQTWQQGIASGLILPQFHAREHLNVPLWMRDLKAGLAPTRLAFEHHFFGLRTKTSSPVQKHYVSAYSPETPDELATITGYTSEGLQSFEHVFGFRSKSFVGCNYVWPVALEPALAEAGIAHFQTRQKRFSPDPSRQGSRDIRRHYTGELNGLGQSFGVRNVFFEPYLDRKKDWVSTALAQIKSAFNLRAPAIVCTHRINYCSHIDPKLSGISLAMLDKLIRQIIRYWPETKFLSSAGLAEHLQQTRSGTKH